MYSNRVLASAPIRSYTFFFPLSIIAPVPTALSRDSNPASHVARGEPRGGGRIYGDSELTVHREERVYKMTRVVGQVGQGAVLYPL